MNWDRFVKDTGPRLFRYFAASLPTSISSELVQEVLIRLVRMVKAGRFDESKGSLVSLAFGIAHNVRCEVYKNAGRLETPLTDQHYATISSNCTPQDAEIDHQQQISQLRSAIQRLQPSEKEVILLMVDRDLSLADIASALNMPLNTVKSHMRRGKQQLRLLLAPI